MLTLREKLDSEQRDESLWKTPGTSRSTAASSLEDRRRLPLLGRTGTPVTKDAPFTKTSRRKKILLLLLPQCDKTHTKINTGHIVAVCEACIRYKHAYKSDIFRLHSFIKPLKELTQKAEREGPTSQLGAWIGRARYDMSLRK